MAIDIDDDSWRRFLEDAIGGLRGAARRLETAQIRQHYEARRGWFGRARRDQGGRRIPKEESISHALVEVLERMRAEQMIEGRLETEINLTRMDFQIEVPRRIEEGIGSQSLPTDIMIAVIHDDLDLRIEAKNILKASEISGEYLGERGLRRFDDIRSPYTIERFGCMVAYVMDDDAARWQARINQAIRDSAPPLTVLTTTIAEEELMTTSHDREVDSPLHGIKKHCRTDVLHFVLEFEAKPSLRAQNNLKP